MKNFFCGIFMLMSVNLTAQNTIYGFEVKTLNGKDFNWDSCKGKVVLIVNTASKCGLTPQYQGLQTLYLKYRDSGLEILAFPCNQFGSQEPGSAEEIADFCSLNYNVTFPLLEKIDVNGKNAHKIYIFLKEKLPLEKGENDIRWNFEKFLINKNGVPLKRFAPSVTPEELKEEILKIL